MEKARRKRPRKEVEKTLRVNLDKEMSAKFTALKKAYGIESDTEMVRLLIQRKWMEDRPSEKAENEEHP